MRGGDGMAKPMQHRAIEVVDVAYVDYATGRPRDQPTEEEAARVAERLVVFTARAVLGSPDVRVVRRGRPDQARAQARPN